MDHDIGDDCNYYTVIEKADRELAEIEAKSNEVIKSTNESRIDSESAQLSVNIHIPKLDPNSVLQHAYAYHLGGNEMRTPPPTAPDDPNVHTNYEILKRQDTPQSADYTHVDFAEIQRKKSDPILLQVPQIYNHRGFPTKSAKLKQRKSAESKPTKYITLTKNDSESSTQRDQAIKSDSETFTYSFDKYPIIASKSKNNIVQRRFALKRALWNSKGLQPITNPVSETERSHNFVFAVANQQILSQIGYNTDLDRTQVIYSPEPSTARHTIISNKPLYPPKSSRRFNSGKTAVTGHSAVTFLYKEKDKFIDDDINDKKPVHDLTPGPQAYHIPRKPLNEKNSPSYSFGLRCFIEKNGGGRTSWQKEWFSSKDPYTRKTNFKSDEFYPSPLNYIKKPSIGDKNQLTWYQYPGFTMGTRLKSTTNLSNIRLSQQSDEIVEAVQQIDNDSQEIILRHSAKKRTEKAQIDSAFSSKNAKITIKSRFNGTILWPKTENTPGPGTHDHTKFTAFKPERPKFSMSQAPTTKFKTYSYGPFAV